LKDLEARGLMTGAERRQLEKAYDLLLRTRTELHYQIPPKSRQVDALLKSLQPVVALELGYPDRSQSRRIEKFMRDLYFNMRNVFLITRTLEERLALLPRPQRLPDLRRFIPSRFRKPAPLVVDGFRFGEGQILAAAPRVFREQPRRLMRVFLHAQQRGLRLHPDLAQTIRQNLDLADRAFLHDEHVRETFLEILGQRGNVAGVLRTMHETGLLGRYLPEFGKLTCLVQHEFYHQYAADEHTLMCLTQLDRVWEAKEQPYAHYAEVFQSVERPFILHLALLLHDAGKALHTGHHSDVGGQLALRVARRLGLDGATAHSLRLLIEQHLTMTQISQRRDLEDQSVIRNFATQIQSAENLRMLTLHTFADSMATSDKLWNSFKDSLLWLLHHKALQVLLGGTDFIRAEERQREILADGVRRILPRTVGDDELEAHFGSLPSRYFQIHQTREIAGDMALIHRFLHKQVGDADDALEPVVSWHNEADRGYTSAKVCTWDRTGLFALINGSFAAAGINILHAQIFSRMDGIVLDTFSVTDAHGGGPVAREARDRFERLLAKSLSDEPVDLQALIARQKTGAGPYQALPGERIPTRVYFDNDSSEHQTVIDIETEDRLGLLYRVAQEFTEVGLDISLAKISTEKGAAIDSFYVSERGGQKVLSPERQRHIAERLLAALTHPD
jgi:[protein-PII] uridylyltransferase